MSGFEAITGPGPGAAATDAAQRAKLRGLAKQLEGVFLAQLFEAMRRSVPQGGAIDPAPGQEMFTQMFDERMAEQAAGRGGSHGLADALYRQLAARLPGPAPTEER